MVILVGLSIVILGIVPVVIAACSMKNFWKEGMIAFGVGIVIYFAYNKLFLEFSMRFLYGMIPWDSPLWSNRWIYGLITCAMTGFWAELSRLLFLLVCNRNLKWNNDLKRNLLVGLGFGWMAVFFSWTYYMIQVISTFVSTGNIERFGLNMGTLGDYLIRFLFEILFYVGLTLLTQYGISGERIPGVFGILFLLHTIYKAVYYIVPYQLNWPLWIANAVAGVISVVVLSLGIGLLKKLPMKSENPDDGD